MTEKLDIARIEADVAKARLTGTVRQMKSSAAPSALIGLAKNAAKARVASFAIGAILGARKRPLMAVGVALASALYTFRKPLIDAFKARSQPGDDK
jgi:hypothetical protein